MHMLVDTTDSTKTSAKSKAKSKDKAISESEITDKIHLKSNSKSKSKLKSTLAYSAHLDLRMDSGSDQDGGSGVGEPESGRKHEVRKTEKKEKEKKEKKKEKKSAGGLLGDTDEEDAGKHDIRDTDDESGDADDDDGDGDENIHQLTINEHYAKAFARRKEREELMRCTSARPPSHIYTHTFKQLITLPTSFSERKIRLPRSFQLLQFRLEVGLRCGFGLGFGFGFGFRQHFYH